MSSLIEKDIEVGSSTLDSQHDGEIITPEADPKAAAKDEAEVDDGSEYITGIRLYLIILGLCMAVLLIGLVCCRLRAELNYKTNLDPGQFYSSYGICCKPSTPAIANLLGGTYNHHSLQFSSGCRVVWLSIPHQRVSSSLTPPVHHLTTPKLCSPTTIRKSLPIFLAEVDIHYLSRHLRIRKFNMCNSQIISDAHRRTSCRGQWCSWVILWSPGYCISYDTFTATAK